MVYDIYIVTNFSERIEAWIASFAWKELAENYLVSLRAADNAHVYELKPREEEKDATKYKKY